MNSRATAAHFYRTPQQWGRLRASLAYVAVVNLQHIVYEEVGRPLGKRACTRPLSVIVRTELTLYIGGVEALLAACLAEHHAAVAAEVDAEAGEHRRRPEVGGHYLAYGL